MVIRLLVALSLLLISETVLALELKDCTLVEVDETNFPESLTYKQMDALASGGCLKTNNGKMIVALNSEAMKQVIPNTGKRIVRKTGAALKIFNEAKAQAFGNVKQTDNLKVRTYQYIPAIGKVGGQFSVKIEEPRNPPALNGPNPEEEKTLKSVEKSDVVATTELQKGKLDPLVISHFIEEQVGALTGLLLKSEADAEENRALIREAVQKADLEAYEYLALWLEKNESQVMFLRQRIYFFENKIKPLRQMLPALGPVDWVTLNGIVININFIHKDIDKEISEFLDKHPDFMKGHPNYPKAHQQIQEEGYHEIK